MESFQPVPIPIPIAKFASYRIPNKKPDMMTHSDWSRKLAEVQLCKSDLNRLVMDYLIVEGCRDAAEEFAREIGLAEFTATEGAEADQDGMELDGEERVKETFNFEGIEERMMIRQAVESGRIDEAVRRVNELDPEILDTHPTLYFHLQLQRLIELLLVPSSSPTQALLFASQTLAPLAASSASHLAELESVLTLLAFPPPGPYPSADIEALVSQDQRRKVGKELNSAILESAGRGVESRLVGTLRLLKWGEGILDSKGQGVPKVEGVWKEDEMEKELAGGV